MREVELLLNERWILKRQHPDLYFRLRDQFAHYQEFFRDKLGYRIIVNSLMVKAEKIPGECQPWMGIQSFETPMDYGILCLVLMFLEDRQAEEQFILEQVTDYVRSNYPQEDRLDWTSFSHRKSLIRVLRFCAEEGMVVVDDGDERGFETGSDVAVLYENTGASKYFVRNFTFDISRLRGVEEFLGQEWQGSDTDRGVMRRHRVYRRLVMNPVVYQSGTADSLLWPTSSDDPDYLYIKNQRSVLANDLEKYLSARFHLHKNGAMLLLGEGALLEDACPGRRNISDIALHLCAVVRQAVIRNAGTGPQKPGSTPQNTGTGPQNQNASAWAASPLDTWTMSRPQWDTLLEDCIKTHSHGWNKAYREETTFHNLGMELLSYMEGFGMVKSCSGGREVRILPALFKVTGRYPEEYLDKRSNAQEDPNG